MKPPAPAKESWLRKLTASALDRARGHQRRSGTVKAFDLPDVPPSVTRGATKMAQDGALVEAGSWAVSSLGVGDYLGQDGFLGFAHLALLAQRPEFRRISEVFATEMTRRWIRITAAGDEDKTDRVQAIEAAFHRLGVRDAFRRCAELDGLFGRAHLSLDFGDTDDLTTPVGDGTEKLSRAKSGKGGLKAIRVIEPIWCYPQGYNSTNPLAEGWYSPALWNVNGTQVHSSRLLAFVGREVPDLLKPAFAFGGLSRSQMAMPYVENWLRTRQSVSDLIHSFTTSGVKTDLGEAMNANGGEGLFRRAALFNEMRDNSGLMLLDKTEEFFKVVTPLGTLDKLQAQALEQICSVSGLPLVIYTGITPSGLNATSEGEIRVFQDLIHAFQPRFFGEHLRTVLRFVQLAEFGNVDDDIGFEFEPLWTLNETERAQVGYVEAQTDRELIQAGAITPAEARQRVAANHTAPYAGLDMSIEPGVPEIAAKQVEATVQAFTAGLLDQGQALRGLIATGMFPTLSEDDAVEADNEPPLLSELPPAAAALLIPDGEDD